MVNVAVDIMGGDNAPAEPVKGAIEAVTSQDGIKVFLCGNKDVIEQELKKYQYPKKLPHQYRSRRKRLRNEFTN